MSLHEFTNPYGFVSLAECLISTVIGVVCFCLALNIKRQNYLVGLWYISLRGLLTIAAIAGLSNAWSLVLLEPAHAKPAEFLVNSALIGLGIWLICFYRFNFVKTHGQHALSQTLKSLHDEFTSSRQNVENSTR